jgi:pimeloyl-ACP methyl ester carboxylesterase
MSLMRINGVRLHVEPAVGAGEPLVLVHGGWTDGNTWGFMIEPLARSFSVVRYDRRGHSRSERGAGPSPRRQDEDDLATLIEALGAGPVHLVGTSYGAAISLALAGRRPELVRSVLAHEPPLIALAPEPEFAAIVAGVQDQIAAGDAEAATRRFFDAVVPDAWGVIPATVQQAAIGNAQTFLDLREDPAWAALDVDAVKAFPGPVLVTYGDAGPPWLPRVAAAVAARVGGDAALIAGAGHNPHHTHPDTLAALIEGNAQPLSRAA